MIWLWILGGIAALFLLFCMLPLGVLVSFEGKAFAWVTLGPLRIQVAPSKPGKKKTKPVKTSEKKKNTQTLIEKLKKFPKPTVAELKSAYHVLWPPMKRALKRTRRGIRIDPLQISLTLAGRDDPATAAELYGAANAIVWTVMPVLEQLLVIPHPGIHLGVDFDRDRMKLRGRIGLSIRIGTLLAIGVGIGIPALKWLLQYQKAHKKPEEQKQPKTEKTDEQAA